MSHVINVFNINIRVAKPIQDKKKSANHNKRRRKYVAGALLCVPGNVIPLVAYVPFVDVLLLFISLGNATGLPPGRRVSPMNVPKLGAAMDYGKLHN